MDAFKSAIEKTGIILMFLGAVIFYLITLPINTIYDFLTKEPHYEESGYDL